MPTCVPLVTMKTILLISLFIAIGNYSFCQENEIKIIDSVDYDVTLRFLDDEYALFVTDWSDDSKGHQLLTYTTVNDTIVLTDSWDEIEVSIDVEYSYNENVGYGLIMLQTFLLHLYEEGFMSNDGFEYEYPCATSSPNDSSDFHHTVVDPCEINKFPLVIHRNKEDDINVDIQIPKGFNHVKINWTGIFSTYFYADIHESLFPMNRTINNEDVVIIFK